MEFKGKITDVSRDLKGGFRLTFTALEDIFDDLPLLTDQDLRVTAQIWRRKRSKNANAYFYALLGKIAQRAGISVTEAHNKAIADYGQPEGTELLLKDGINWMRIEQMHLKPVPGIEIAGEEIYNRYIVMRGSHTYDTAEMAALIEGTIADAKALGIETLTPSELEDMMRTYEINHRKKRA